MSAVQQELDELLLSCTVRFDVPKRGTGFFIAPNRILTCAHVVTGGTDIQITLPHSGGRSFRARVVAAFPAIMPPPDPYPLPDLAIVEVDSADSPYLPIDPDVRADDLLYAFGYPQKYAHEDPYPHGDGTTFSFGGSSHPKEGFLLKLAHGLALPGLSGAPVFNRRTGAVCAIIKKSDQTETARAVPAKLVIDTVSEFVQLDRIGLKLRAGLVQYLSHVVAQPEDHGHGYLFGRSAADLFVSPLVTTRRTTGSLLRRIARLSVNASDAQESGLRVPGENEAVVEDWLAASRQFQRGVLIGLPGGGKTLIAQMTARRIAQASLAALEGKSVDRQTLEIPVYLRMADVARDGLAEAVERLVDRAVPDGLQDELSKELQGVLRTNRCVLFLDAMDEVQTPNELKKALEPLRDSRCRVLTTSRLYGYAPHLLPFEPEFHYEIIALDANKRDQYIDLWFKADETGAAHIRSLIAAQPQIASLTRNPLLLSLSCAVAESDDLSGLTRRADLYRVILRALVRGSTYPDHDPHVTLNLRLLRRTAWDLFASAPAQTVFSDDRWFEAIKTAMQGGAGVGSIPEFLNEMQSKGIIFVSSSGFRMFLHRSFLDFLAAEEIAHRPLETAFANLDLFLWREDTQKILHWSPVATEMISLVAGCMADPNPLLDRLLALNYQPEGLFNPMLLLTSRGLRECDPVDVRPELQNEILEKVLSSFEATLTESMMDDAVACLPASGLIRAVRSHPREQFRAKATQALGRMGPFAIETLTLAIRDPNYVVRQAAADALIHVPKAQKVLADALVDPEWRIRAPILQALLNTHRSHGLGFWSYIPHEDELAAANKDGKAGIHGMPAYDVEVTYHLARAMFPCNSDLHTSEAKGTGGAPCARLIFLIDSGAENGAGFVCVKWVEADDVLLFHPHLQNYSSQLSAIGFEGIKDLFVNGDNTLGRYPERESPPRSIRESTSHTPDSEGATQSESVKLSSSALDTDRVARVLRAATGLRHPDTGVVDSLLHALSTPDSTAAYEWWFGFLRYAADLGRAQIEVDVDERRQETPVTDAGSEDISAETPMTRGAVEDLSRRAADHTIPLSERRAAVLQLKQYDDHRAFEALLCVAGNPDEQRALRSEALDGALELAEMDPKKVEDLLILIACTDGADALRRKAAVELRDRRVVRAMDSLAGEVEKLLRGETVPWELLDAYYVLERTSGRRGFVRNS